jgi:hypothetical protein
MNVGRAEGLNRFETTNQCAACRHLLGAHRQRQADGWEQAFGYERYGDAEREQKGVGQLNTHQQRDGKEDRADNETHQCDDANHTVQLERKRSGGTRLGRRQLCDLSQSRRTTGRCHASDALAFHGKCSGEHGLADLWGGRNTFTCQRRCID